jgi:hypothetical protein
MADALSGIASLVIKTMQDGVVSINGLTQAILNVFPRTTGTFTLAAAATTTVAQPSVKSTSMVVLSPTNAAAATLMGGTKSLYVQSITPGTGFVVATGDGTNAVGTCTFSYAVFSPS